MLYEREYIKNNRQFYKGFKEEYPALFWVLFINIVAFVLESVLSRWFPSNIISKLLPLSLDGIQSGFVWEFFTYSIIHAGLLHILFNMLAIFFVGRFAEAKLGMRNFFILYLMGIFFGGIFWALSAYFISPINNAILCGASAGTLALITFFCLNTADRPMTFLLFFVLPVTLRPKVMLYILIGFEVFSYLTGETAGASGVANSAHLGGIFAGYLFTILFRQDFFSTAKFNFKSKRSPIKASNLKYTVNMVDVEELKKQANLILEKVSKKGLNSLTETERNILKQYKDYI